LAEVILAALKQFATGRNKIGVPITVFPEEDLTASISKAAHKRAAIQWQAELDKMIVAFTILANDDIGEELHNRVAVDAGLQSFAKYFQNLWD
jgi:hypothetical protein